MYDRLDMKNTKIISKNDETESESETEIEK